MGYYVRYTLKVHPPKDETWLSEHVVGDPPFEIPWKSTSGYRGFPPQYEKMAEIAKNCKETTIEVPNAVKNFFGLYPLCRVVFGIEMSFPGTQVAILSGEKSSQYDWETELKELSQIFPDYVFQLDASGEEPGDLWRAYFKNGKMQEAPARIVFDSFDESKLGRNP